MTCADHYNLPMTMVFGWMSQIFQPSLPTLMYKSSPTASFAYAPSKSSCFSVYPLSISSIYQGRDNVAQTHLQYLKLLQTILHKLLHSSFVCLLDMLSEGIARAAGSVFTEVVCGELFALTEEGAVLQFSSAHVRRSSSCSIKVDRV